MYYDDTKVYDYSIGWNQSQEAYRTVDFGKDGVLVPLALWRVFFYHSKRQQTVGELQYNISFDNTYYICTGIGGKTGSAVSVPATFNGKPIRYVGESAFINKTQLNSVVLANNVKGIAPYAFYGCSNLTSIDIPNSVNRIWHQAFRGCTALSSINIPSAVTGIEDYTFYGCKSLTSVVIQEGTTEIGESAFQGCTSLKTLTIPSTLKSVGENALKGVDLDTIYYNGTEAEFFAIDGMKSAYQDSIDGGLKFVFTDKTVEI
jgi:hypothetical protein